MTRRAAMKRFQSAPLALALAIVVVAGLGSGCAGKSDRPRSRGGGGGGNGIVDEVHLFGVPVALDLDGRPGPDGVGVRVYASEGGRAHGVAIRDGHLEILMFDGAFEAPALAGRAPLKVWTFAPKELAPFSADTSLGTGYQLALSWGANRPTGRGVTLLARYVSPDGRALVSSPNSIPLR